MADLVTISCDPLRTLMVDFYSCFIQRNELELAETKFVLNYLMYNNGI